MRLVRRAARLLPAAALLAAGWPAVARAQRCPAPAPLVSDLPPLKDPTRVEVLSDGATVTPGGDAVLSGKVSVRQGNRLLTAHDARYDAATGSFAVEGSVEYRDPLLRLAGESGNWSSADGGRFGAAQFELPARPARGRAGSIRLAPDGKLDLEHVEYTACPVGRHDWLLRADHIRIDQQAQQGVGRNVEVEFKGVPILYLPVISFPVGDARKTGFLFPSFGTSSRNGFELGAPYYLDLAPNYDATLTPGYLSRRGATLGSEFRFLTGDSRGVFQSDWVPSDSAAHRDRSYLRFTDRTEFSGHLRFDTTLAQASDSNYFEDFGRDPAGTSVTYLQRLAQLTYLDRNWRIIGLVEDFQTIDTSIAPVDRPYARAPQLALNGRWLAASGLGFNLRGEAVNFARSTGVTGSRFDLEPTLSWALRRPGVFLVPALGFDVTRYALQDAGTAGSSPSRAAPIATLDAGLTFERVSGQRLQTIEPRVLYTYIPYRNQDNLPIFDTGLPDLNVVQLFRSQRYVGGDRLGDAKQVAVGATTRLVDLESGREWISATLGQTYYFTPPRVRLATEAAVATGSSDIVGQLAVAAYRNWNVQLGQQWDPHAQRSELSEVRLQYQPAPERVANLSYRFRRGLLEQLDGSFAWPVADAWNLYARHVYSLKDKAAIDTFGGFEYRACCWQMRILGRRYVISSTGQRDTSISLQLELNGLSGVGEKAGAFLERSIRGYSPAAVAPAPVSTL